jgi:NADPH:quinone reductase-like Zn-dependent oxidoreductase
MKAIVLTKFGPPDVLQLQKVAKPAPKWVKLQLACEKEEAMIQ